MKNETQKEQTNWLDATDIKTPITYLGIEGAATVNFYFDILMSETEKELRQKHFALPETEQPAARHKYNVEMISRLASRRPENLPGFDAAFEAKKAGQSEREAIAAAIMEVLSPETPVRVKLADDALNYYTTINQPAEFFR